MNPGRIDRADPSESESLYRSFVELAGDGIYFGDQRGRFFDVNPAGCAMLGCTRDELRDKSFADFVATEEKARLDAVFERVAVGERVVEEWSVRGGDGRFRRVELSMQCAPGGVWHAIGREVSPRGASDAGRNDVDARLRLFAAAGNGGIVQVGADDRILEADENFCRLLGYGPGELRGVNVLELTAPEDRPLAARRRQRRAEGIGERYEMKLRRKDGTEVWVFCNTVVLEERGRYSGTSSLMMDITDRRRTEEALRASDRRLRLALKAARMVAWEVDPRSGQAVVLDNAAEVFGLPPEERLETTQQGFELMHPDDVARHREEFARALSTGGSYVTQFRILRQDTRAEVWIEERAQAIVDEHGKVVRFVGVMLDITERKRADDERERLMRELQVQHARSTEILESISDAFYAVDADFRFTYVNRKAEEWWQRPRDQLIGRHYWTEFPKALGSESHRMHARAMAERRPQHYETVSPLLERWIEVSLYPEAGGGLSCYFRDVSDRKRAEVQLREQERRQRFLLGLGDALRNLTDPAAVMAAAAEALGRHLVVSRVGYGEIDALQTTVTVERDWTDGSVASLAGLTRALEIFGPSVIAELRAGRTLRIDNLAADPRAAMFAAGQADRGAQALLVVPLVKGARLLAVLYLHERAPRRWTDAEMRLAEEVGERTWAAAEAARAQAALRAAHALLSDKAGHLETLVQQRTAKLRETVGELEAFSYSIAHDMRAPLRSLRGFSEILLDEHAQQLDEVGQSYLRRIGKSAARMDRLIQDVLSYSRVVRAELPFETVDIAQLLHDIVATYPALAADKAHVSFDGTFPPVFANEALLTQVFSNLLGNAAKFVRPDAKPEIRLWTEVEGQRVRVFVQDNGIGIPPEQHEKIFGIFEQLSRDYEGTGIGLAIVKKAVERMGGKVGVRSSPGAGSTFFVDLPQA